MVLEQQGSELSEQDRQAIASAGVAVEEIERQLAIFRRGTAPVRLDRPCTPGDGIAIITAGEHQALLAVYEEARENGRLMKFVPASGAASRMFREWYAVLRQGGFADSSEEDGFLTSLEHYAFYPELEKAAQAKGDSLRRMIDNRQSAGIIELILTEKGLNYGKLPKALLSFHAYPEGARSALEEHLVEAALYVRDSNRIARVHFTVSAEHEKIVRERLLQVIRTYENHFDTVFDYDVSIQDPAANTIAVDLAGQPFRDENGAPLLRPSGHGALIKNLDELDAEAVFVKNIDNVTVDHYKGDTFLWKKLLAGYLFSVQKEIFAHLLVLENPGSVAKEIPGIARFCKEKLNIELPAFFPELPDKEKRHYLFHKLNRPLRVCGMVKNEGEPGGGPFWAANGDEGAVCSLQIVENAQIDGSDPEQKKAWLKSTHFNPVDLVCGLRDYRGRKFALNDFIDQKTYIITEKSEKGRDVLSLERPGLWNGSMAFWNTIFIEVPPTTFSPVKTVKDLLRWQHQ